MSSHRSPQPTLISPKEKVRTRVQYTRVLNHEDLDEEGFKAEFARLNDRLRLLGDGIAVDMDAIAEHLDEMQMLLSQRGSKRGATIRVEAGLPTWTEYATQFAERLGRKLWWLQNLIRQRRQPGLKVPKKYESAQFLSRGDQRALIEYAGYAGDLVWALTHDQDPRPALKALQAKAIRPDKLEGMLNGLKATPDPEVKLAKLEAEVKELLQEMAAHIDTIPKSVVAKAEVLGRTVSDNDEADAA